LAARAESAEVPAGEQAPEGALHDQEPEATELLSDTSLEDIVAQIEAKDALLPQAFEPLPDKEEED
jgi:hypothetical protein